MTPQATRPCPDCGTPNALDAETCVECNHPIDPFARKVTAPPSRPRPERPPEPASPVPGAPLIREQQGKVIPRRHHQRAGLFGIGSEDRPRAAGGAPGWIWAAVGAAALLIALGTAIGITSQRSRVNVEGADAAKLATADSLDKILRKNPNDVKALVEMGNVYYDTKNFADAVGFYDKALAEDSTLVDVAVDRAVALDQAGHADQAVRDLESIVARHPDHAIASFDLAVIYEFQGRKEDAEREYKNAAQKATSADVQHVATMRLKQLEGTMPPAPPQP